VIGWYGVVQGRTGKPTRTKIRPISKRRARHLESAEQGGVVTLRRNIYKMGGAVVSSHISGSAREAPPPNFSLSFFLNFPARRLVGVVPAAPLPNLPSGGKHGKGTNGGRMIAFSLSRYRDRAYDHLRAFDRSAGCPASASKRRFWARVPLRGRGPTTFDRTVFHLAGRLRSRRERTSSLTFRPITRSFCTAPPISRPSRSRGWPTRYQRWCGTSPPYQGAAQGVGSPTSTRIPPPSALLGPCSRATALTQLALLLKRCAGRI